jgi:hypothetical protein
MQGTLAISISTICVRRLSCSQRQRGFGVVGGVAGTFGILGATFHFNAPEPTAAE